jgi:hypothetical protein
MARQIETPQMMAIKGRQGSGSGMGQALGTIAGGVVGALAGRTPGAAATGASLGGSLGGAIGGEIGDKGKPGAQGLGSPTVSAAQRRVENPSPQAEDPISTIEQARMALSSLPPEQQKEFGPILTAGSKAFRSKQNA